MAFFPLFYRLKFFTPTNRGLYLVGGGGGGGGAYFLSKYFWVKLSIFHPYESWPLFSGWWVVVGRFFSKYFWVKMSCIFFVFFLNLLSY